MHNKHYRQVIQRNRITIPSIQIYDENDRE